METKLHNVNFYHAEPQGINCLALNKNTKLLALSRSDASIEIWNMKYAPILIKTIPGVEKGSIEALGWINDRLISTGLAGALVEWDLRLLQPKSSVLLTGYAAWCLDINHSNTQVAVGTEQGFINLYNIYDENFQYDKLFDKQEGRIMCCKFHKNGEVLVTGSEGTLRVWNVRTGHAIYKMLLNYRGVDKIIWSVAILSDMTIISADSSGRLTFWDGNIGEQLDTYTTHRTDILTLCVSDDEDSLYCCGVDPLIVNMLKVKVQNKDNVQSKWIRNVQRHIHEHDVRALALDGNKLISVGADGYLTISKYPPKTLMRIPPMSCTPRIILSNNYLLLRYNKHIEVWRLGKYTENKKGEPILIHNNISKSEKQNKNYNLEQDTSQANLELDTTLINMKENVNKNSKKLVKIEREPLKIVSITAKKNKTITACGLSPSGQFIVYATESVLRIFKFEMGEEVLLSKVMPIPEECIGATHIAFVSENVLIVASSSSRSLLVLNIDPNAGAGVVQTINFENLFKDNILHLVTGRTETHSYIMCSDCTCRINVWKSINNGSYKHYSTLPTYHCLTAAMAINVQRDTLIVTYVDQKVIEYNLLKQCVDESIDSLLPIKWKDRTSSISSIIIHPYVEDVIIFHDELSMWILNKRKRSKPKHSLPKKKIGNSKKMIEKSNTTNEHYFMKIISFKYLAGFQFTEGNEAVAVHLLPDSIISQLPPIYRRKRFQTA